MGRNDRLVNHLTVRVDNGTLSRLKEQAKAKEKLFSEEVRETIKRGLDEEISKE